MVAVEGAESTPEVGMRKDVDHVSGEGFFDRVVDLAFVEELGVVFWEVFFLIPMGRGRGLAFADGLMGTRRDTKHSG